MGLDKPISEMTNEEILLHLKNVRERREAAAKEAQERAANKNRKKTPRVIDADEIDVDALFDEVVSDLDKLRP